MEERYARTLAVRVDMHLIEVQAVNVHMYM